MDTESLLSLKLLPECCSINEIVINKIKSYFKESNIKYVKKNKKQSSVLKNSNFNLKKNSINNKIIFILNKLSETNIDNIIIEFIENIKIDSIESYDILQIEIFEKILKDDKFIEIYSDFYIKIIKYIYAKYEYTPSKLLSIIENFINIYNEKQELTRIIFLKFIKIMINKKFFNNSIINFISEFLIKYKLIPDIKFWYESFNLDKKCLKGIVIENVREKLMYESIFEENININKDLLKVNESCKDNKSNIFLTQCENIIEEYNYLNLNDEIKYFIENECKSNNNKLYFMEYIIKLYCQKKQENIYKLFEYIVSKNIISSHNIINVLKKLNNSKSIKYNLNKFILVLKKKNINISI